MVQDLTSVFVEAAAAFANVHPRVSIALAPSPLGAMVTMIARDSSGRIESVTEQDVCLRELESVSAERARAFFAGCASALRSRIDAGVRVEAFVPEDIFVAVILRSPSLVTAEDFANALLDPWGIRMQLEIDELCARWAREYPEAIAAIADDADRELVDALFGLGNDRFGTMRRLQLLTAAAKGERRHVAPILVAFIELTARDEDFLAAAYLSTTGPIAHPVAPDLAFHILRKWGVPLPARDRWCAAHAISDYIVEWYGATATSSGSA